jgi:hypothetical protein
MPKLSDDRIIEWKAYVAKDAGVYNSVICFDNDAASCYDRIIPALASLISQKYGMHRNVVFVHVTTLAGATSLGISEEFYKNCQAFPIYSTGQGSNNFPAIWCIISSTLFCVIKNRHMVPIYVPPIKR